MAIVVSRREISDADTGALLVSTDNMTFCRGDGGFGGPAASSAKPAALPERTPDAIVTLPTLPQAALIYRLSGDHNPLHADPAVATKAGFARPILHGLATYGVACHAVLQAVCGYDPARLRSIGVRFSAPVYPGETIRTEIWHEEGGAAFRARVVERDKVVVSNGLFRYA